MRTIENVDLDINKYTKVTTKLEGEKIKVTLVSEILDDLPELEQSLRETETQFTYTRDGNKVDIVLAREDSLALLWNLIICVLIPDISHFAKSGDSVGLADAQKTIHSQYQITQYMSELEKSEIEYIKSKNPKEYIEALIETNGYSIPKDLTISPFSKQIIEKDIMRQNVIGMFILCTNDYFIEDRLAFHNYLRELKRFHKFFEPTPEQDVLPIFLKTKRLLETILELENNDDSTNDKNTVFKKLKYPILELILDYVSDENSQVENINTVFEKLGIIDDDVPTQIHNSLFQL